MTPTAFSTRSRARTGTRWRFAWTRSRSDGDGRGVPATAFEAWTSVAGAMESRGVFPDASSSPRHPASNPAVAAFLPTLRQSAARIAESASWCASRWLPASGVAAANDARGGARSRTRRSTTTRSRLGGRRVFGRRRVRRNPEPTRGGQGDALGGASRRRSVRRRGRVRGVRRGSVPRPRRGAVCDRGGARRRGVRGAAVFSVRRRAPDVRFANAGERRSDRGGRDGRAGVRGARAVHAPRGAELVAWTVAGFCHKALPTCGDLAAVGRALETVTPRAKSATPRGEPGACVAACACECFAKRDLSREGANGGTYSASRRLPRRRRSVLRLRRAVVFAAALRAPPRA